MKQDLRAQRVNFRFNPEFSGLKMWFIHMGGICAADFTCSTARYVQNRKRSAGTAAYWAVAWFPLSGERAHNYIDKP